MTKRTRRTLLIVAGLILVLAVAVFLRSKAPPEAARLLPESDGVLYFNLKPVRVFFHKQIRPPQRVPEYQQFVEATGIDWEQDLDAAAIALHRMADPRGPNGPVAYSMVLVGRLNRKGPDGRNHLNDWLQAHSAARENYAGHTIYSIPSEGRTVRVAQVGYDMLAVSNTPTPEQIHSILDRHSTAAWPFAGSSILRQHFHDVPLLALAWGVGQIGLPFSESGSIHVFGLALPLEDNATLVASLSPGLGLETSLRARFDEIVPGPADQARSGAERQAAALATLVTLARGLAVGLGPNTANNSFRELLRTTEVTSKGNRVVVTATLSPSTLSNLTASAPAAEPATPTPAK
jgi:hypothetical protein